jgi:ureidoglycolate lyase
MTQQTHLSTETVGHAPRRSFLEQAGLSFAALAAAAYSDIGAAVTAPLTGSTNGASALIPPLDPNNAYATNGAPPKANAETHTKRRLKVEVANAENFAPFGRVLTPEGRKRLPINTYGDKMNLFRESFESDQPIEWFIFQGYKRWNGVLFLERHQQLTQTFIPVGGKPFYTVVAPAGCSEENGFPALDEMRAFLVPGDAVIQVNRATWHENPMPLQDDTRMLVTSHSKLTYAHQQNPDPRLASTPLDLERRWYKAGGYELTLDV